MTDVVDVVVVGSGGAGLTAALTAATGGAETVVLEASGRWGGTTSISGGVVWVPDNHRMPEVGIGDSTDDALAYCFGHGLWRDRTLLEAYVHSARAMARFVEEHAPVRFRPMRHPDTFAEAPGGRRGGRHLEVAPVEIGDACPPEELGWSAPTRLTNDEVGGLLSGAGQPAADLIAQRRAARQVTMGAGLVAGLLRGCRRAGVAVERNCRVRELLRDDTGAVNGVCVNRSGAASSIRARRGVVLAAGGFEHDPGLRRRLLGGPENVPLSPPVARGDGLRLAATAGADLAHLGDGWRWPAAQVPGATWGDPQRTEQARMVMTERMLPHVIWVNRLGRRFVNEAAHNCGFALGEREPGSYHPRNLPAWAVGDAQFRSRYPLAGLAPGRPSPPWLIEAGSLAELAATLGISGAALVDTVSRFNRFAAAGCDEDFGRGESMFERDGGDPRTAHPVLGTVAEPPFFALPIRSGLIGTQGGPRTDVHARVLDWDGAPIPGLFAAGGTMAAVFGPGMIANGLTLGTALTWGWLAGRTAAG